MGNPQPDALIAGRVRTVITLDLPALKRAGAKKASSEGPVPDPERAALSEHEQKAVTSSGDSKLSKPEQRLPNWIRSLMDHEGG